MVIGSQAKGTMVGEFPGLATLDEDDNLRHTTDFRSVYCSLLEQWLRVDADGDRPRASSFARPSWCAERAPPGSGRRACSPGCSRSRPRAARDGDAARQARRQGLQAGQEEAVAARTSSVARPTPIRVREAQAARRGQAGDAQALRRGAGAPQGRRAGRPRRGRPPPRRRSPAPPPRRRPRPTTRRPPRRPSRRSNPFAVQVRSGEFFLQLSKPEVHAGNVRVEFNNRTAEDPHDLHLFREDGTGASYAFGELQSGEVEAKTLKLNAGTWRLLCALPEHAERGMSVKLRVVAG